MDLKLTVDEKEYHLSEQQKEEIRRICPQYASLSSKTLSELEGYDFYIGDYQRGYRWTKSEIEELLEDIESIKDDGQENYCMQPLVIKEVKEKKYQKKLGEDGEGIVKNSFELLDGQQRLTTIWFIKNFLCEGEEGYSIYYENIRSIDKHYIDNAKKIISEWFNKKGYYKNPKKSGKSSKKDIKGNDKSFEWKEGKKEEYISKLEKVFFIWYEVKDDNSVSAEKIFRNINMGKIDLTNAELFKALLLNSDSYNDQGGKDSRKLDQIAFEWDKLESGLRDDDFWYFISNVDIEEVNAKTRIDYIIDIYASKINEEKNMGFDENKEYFSFLTIQRYLDLNKKTEIEDVWEEIVGVYDKLYSWYKDEELYHTIGFLVTVDKSYKGTKSIVSNNLKEIVKDSEKEKLNTIGEVKNYVKKKIYRELGLNKEEIGIKDICYEYDDGKGKVDKSTLRKILLFTNIYAMAFQNGKCDLSKKEKTRFPFRLYSQTSWDIEHISPKEIKTDLKGISEFEEFKSNLEALMEDIEEDDTSKKKISNYLENIKEENYKNEPNYSIICKIWEDYAEGLNSAPDNNITNLVLLNSSINRSYGNAFFNSKRKVIIENDKMGVFIPICTRNVFMKYYSDIIKSPTRWTPTDKKEYGKFITDMLNAVKGWKKNE